MIPDDLAARYAIALTLTLAIETPIVAAALARWYRVSAWRGVALAVVASLVTHPVVWFVLPPLVTPNLGTLGYLGVAEGFAWLVEAAIFRLAIPRDPFELLLLSLIANLASFTVGAALTLAGVW